jgi:hypothetical protein
MRSAFGVEHTVTTPVSKSLSGGVFKPASKLSQAERKAVGGYRKAKGVTAADRVWAQNQKNIKTLHGQKHPGMKHTKTVQGRQGTTEHYKHSKRSTVVPPGADGFHVRTGGKKGTSYIHMKSNARKDVTAHEVAHASPKRTAYRMNQVATNPKKTMAEEGRADYVATGHYLKTKPQSGYAQAARMRNAEVRGEKQAKKAQKYGGKPARSLVRARHAPSRFNVKAASGSMSRTMNKPVGRKEIDEYRKVQDRMHGGAPKTPGMSTRKKVAIGAGTTGVAGGGTYAVRRNRKKKNG